MQLLYGNDGTNYRTISKSGEITSEQEKRLLDGYCAYEYVEDREEYSSSFYEPRALSYVTTDLGGALPSEMILLAMNARMTNYQTPSSYAHFCLIEKSKDLYGESFPDLLHYSFVKDVELNDYLLKSIDTFIPQPKNKWKEIRKDALEKEKMLPVVASVMDAVDSLNRKVNLILDVEGDSYNQRALEVISTIYTYLPYNIRIKAGFSTYTATEIVGAGRITLQLYTRDALNKIGDNVIDLANIKREHILNKISPDIVNLVKEIIERDATERRELFLFFQHVFGIKSATVKEHIDLVQKKEVWKNSDLKEIQDELARYAYNEMKRENKSAVFKFFQEVISARVKKECFDDCYQEILGGLLARQYNFAFGDKLRAYIMLGEAIEGLHFDKSLFQCWLKVAILEPAEEEYNNVQLYQCIQNHLHTLQKTQVGGEKYKEIVSLMEEVLQKKLNNLNRKLLGDMKGKIEKFKTQIWRSRRDILLADRNVDAFLSIYADHNISTITSDVMIGENTYTFLLRDLADLAEAILCLDNENKIRLKRILTNKNSLIKDLLAIKAFGEEHFLFLLSVPGGEPKEILNYYLKEDILLSEETVREQIEKMDEKMLLDREGDVVCDNILGVVLKKIEGEGQEEEENGREREELQLDWEPEEDSAGIFIGAMLPAVLFLITAIFKVRTDGDTRVLVFLSMTGIFVLITVAVMKFLFRRFSEKHLGAVLGSGISVFTVWLAWLIF